MYWNIQELINKMDTTPIPYIKLTVYGMLIGILVEWYSLNAIFKGHFKVNWLIVPTLLLMILAFIPDYYWFAWFGVGKPWFVAPFRFRESQMALDIITGILLVRSLSNGG
ncbi:hypothetical protein [Pontibacillus marinus]|uniref:Uncharacterized protein n=1 Tax=Pontibacillus marinus BH030004 = DSM 16465 TaxID=1385511 RepID=A0A0A5FWW9_9BACI|nr:hypothetical protein [Pontibacillus marinus]KGX83205.1 hypothetical protein N783_05755 [Pontibacillus marinus BH030004 = DSM 16465]